MRELEGRSYSEIAEILDVSASAVETLIFRARRALREQLEGSLTCGEAEFAISRQLDGRLPRQERGQLRAHLRECSECASFARRQRAQRGALKSLALVPVPGSLGSFFGGSGATVATGVGLKAAAAVTAGLVIGGAGYEGVRHTTSRAHGQPAAPVFRSVAPAASVPAPREHIPLAAGGKSAAAHGHGASAKHGHARGAHGKNGKATGHGKRAHNKHYVGDASVAARHTHVSHPVHPTRVTHTSHRPAKPKHKQLPGPYDHGPPAGKKR
jgi:hypothetical protein